MKTINARNAACVEPMAAIKAEISRGETELEVLMDDPISASEAVHYLEGCGFSVKLKDDDGNISISANQRDTPPKPLAFKKQPVESVSSLRPRGAVWKSGNVLPSGSSQSSPLPSSSSPKSLSVLITGSAIGSPNDHRELGETLMKSFLMTLPMRFAYNSPALSAVVLVNEGVKLALYNSSACDHLKNLEKHGVSVLVCATCVNYFSIMDQVGVGAMVSMPEILEALDKTDKTMTV